MTQGDLDRLLSVARAERPADEVWPAAAAAIEVLWWYDRFADARALAEETISRFSGAPGRLFDHDLPWDEAILIGAEMAGDDAVRAASRVSEIVPVDRVLGKRLRWLIGELPGRTPHELLSGCDVDLIEHRRFRPLKPFHEAMLEGDLSALSNEERRKLWSRASSAGRGEVIVRIYDSGYGPRSWLQAHHLARQLIKADRVADATAALIDNLDLWFTESPWHVAPSGITTQPDMRRAVTPELRAAVLSNVDITRVPGVAE